MCNSNNLLYTPKPHEFRAYRADGTIVQKGDEMVGRHATWYFVSCTHPRKVYVEVLEDPTGPHSWPNRATQEFYASVFDLGIYDMTGDEWTFPPSWDKSDIDAKLYEEFENRNTNNLTDSDVWASYDKNIQTDEPVKTDSAAGYDVRPMFDKLFNNMAEKLFSDKPAKTDKTDELGEWDGEGFDLKPLKTQPRDEWAETDMWELVDQLYQRVTKCDGTVILTPRPKSDSSVVSRLQELNAEHQDKTDNLEEASEANLPWVSPGPSEADIADQADRVRRADAWVETGVWEKSDKPELPVNTDEPYKHYDMGNQGNRETFGETDIADDDDKAELIRESDEQAELNETDKREFCIVFHPNHVNKDDCTEPFNKDSKE